VPSRPIDRPSADTTPADSAAAAGSPAASAPTAPGTGKGRPTPKRSEAQRGRRGGPVAPPPRTRKEAAQRAREQAKTARTQVREGRTLLPRDAGPVRALVRDVVDARRSIGTLMLPLAFVLLLAQASGNRRVFDIGIALWLFGILALITDLVLTGRVLRRRLREQFPELTKLRSHIAYGLLRTTVFRRWRIPAPTVPRGRR